MRFIEPMFWRCFLTQFNGAILEGGQRRWQALQFEEHERPTM